jgi:hypothetical protein
MALAVLLLLCPLVVSGHLPPRGLVTGTVYKMSASDKGLRAPGPTLVFQQAGSWMEFDTAADPDGRYSATLPPGRYRILAPYASWLIPGLHPDPVTNASVSAYLALVLSQHGQEPPVVTIVAGEHVTVDAAFSSP